MKKLTNLILALLLLLSLTATAFAGETVQSQIDALPTVEEFAAMDGAAQNEAYTRTQQAYDAYMALPEEDRAEIPGAEETFEALFTYFNSQVMPLEEAEEPEVSVASEMMATVLATLAALVLLPMFVKKRKQL